jgi:cytochrome P450
LLSTFNSTLPEVSRYTAEEWITQLITNEGMHKSSYLSYCVTETLRLDPSVRIPSPMEFTEDVVLESNGARILKDQRMLVNIAYLHTNPDQWIAP